MVKGIGKLSYWVLEIQRRMEAGRKKVRGSGEENQYYIGEIDRMEKELMDGVEGMPDPMIDFGLGIMEMEVEQLCGRDKKGIIVDGKVLYLGDENGIDDVVKKINDNCKKEKY